MLFSREFWNGGLAEATDTPMRSDRIRVALALTGLVAVILAGCGAPTPAEPETPVSVTETVTYAGDIPCADCPGISIVLTLFPDSTFRLRNTYLEAEDGRDMSFHDLGRWEQTGEENNRLVLDTGERPWQFRFFDGGDGLRMLDSEGAEVLSGLNYDLTRQAVVDPVAGPMPLEGMYVYMADAASLTECRTGRQFPVLIEADHLALERAYLEAREEPGQPVWAAFEGRFVERAPEPGMALREHIVVERFDRISPDAACR